MRVGNPPPKVARAALLPDDPFFRFSLAGEGGPEDVLWPVTDNQGSVRSLVDFSVSVVPRGLFILSMLPDFQGRVFGEAIGRVVVMPRSAEDGGVLARYVNGVWERLGLRYDANGQRE